MEEKDLEFLREQLSRLDEPELPPTLTSEALFARMDEGTLTLPEEEPAREERKVIPWGRIARRWAPVAACLALALLLYQGYEVGLARNFVGGTPQLTASGAPEPAAAAPQSSEATAYDTDAAPEEEPAEENGLLRMAENAPAEMAEDSFGSQKSAVTDPASPSSAPAPAPALPNTGGSESSVESSRPEPDSGSSSGGNSGGKPNPDTGGSDNPDSGGPDPTRPPDFILDSGEEGPSLYKRVKSQMEEIAAENIPVGTVSSRTVSMYVDDNDLLVFDAVYADESQTVRARARFYCWYYEGKGEAWLEVRTFEWLDN